MAVRTYRDAQGRTRHLVEFQQAGIRVIRRCPPGVGRAEAQALETRIRGEIFASVDLGKQPEISLEEAITRWVSDTVNHKKDKRKPLQNAILLAPFVAGKTLRQVPDAARSAAAAWGALTAATINRRLCVLKATAKYCYRQGWIEDNLSGRITLLPEHNKREVYLTAEQVRTLAFASTSPTLRAAILLAAYTGLRASELLALTAKDITRDTLRVVQSKTGKPRAVPIVGLLRPYLSALPLGLSYSSLYSQFCVARVKAKMPHVHFHDLRHSTASMLINAGVDLYTVGAILGHSSPNTTARYAHLVQATLKRAMGKLR